MKSLSIIGCIYNEEQERIEVIKSIVRDDDVTELNLHSIHVEAIEWKAAELGLDSQDILTLIDVILYEPFLNPDDTRDILVKAQEVKQELSPKVKAAKLQLRAQLTSAGVDKKYLDAVENDVYDLMARHSHFDKELIDIKTKHFRDKKASVQMETEPKSRLEIAKRVLTDFPIDNRTARTNQVVEVNSKQLKTIRLKSGKRVKDE
jgi:hypothetical protein